MTPRSNDGTELEGDIHFIYTLLLASEGKPQRVEKRAKVKGISNVYHEIDVFYEFTRAGVTHRVAIECKDHGRPIAVGDVIEFW